MLAVCSVLVFGEQKHLVIVNIFDNFCPVATASFIPCEDKTLSQFERVASPCLKITILIPILFQHNSFCYLSLQILILLLEMIEIHTENTILVHV